MSELSAWGFFFGPHAECWLSLGQRKREEMLPASSRGEGDLTDDAVKRLETIERNEGKERVTVGGGTEGRLRAESSQLASSSVLKCSVAPGPLVKRSVCVFMMKMSRLWNAFRPTSSAANSSLLFCF